MSINRDQGRAQCQLQQVAAFKKADPVPYTGSPVKLTLLAGVGAESASKMENGRGSPTTICHAEAGAGEQCPPYSSPLSAYEMRELTLPLSSCSTQERDFYTSPGNTIELPLMVLVWESQPWWCRCGRAGPESVKAELAKPLGHCYKNK